MYAEHITREGWQGSRGWGFFPITKGQPKARLLFFIKGPDTWKFSQVSPTTPSLLLSYWVEAGYPIKPTWVIERLVPAKNSTLTIRYTLCDPARLKTQSTLVFTNKEYLFYRHRPSNMPAEQAQPCTSVHNCRFTNALNNCRKSIWLSFSKEGMHAGLMWACDCICKSRHTCVFI